MTLESFREYFEPIYKKEIDSLFLDFSSYSHNKEIQKLIKKVVALSSGGKRIRAYVCALSYEPKNLKSLSEIKNQLIAIELLHFFALVHDDLMDNSLLRHGTPTINSYGKTESEVLKSKNEAIIIGDYIFACSYKLFLKNNKSPKSVEYFQTLIEEVIFGQTFDLELSQNTKYTVEDVTKKMLYKTARYTFTRPIQIGILLKENGAQNSTLKKAEWFGDSMGTIFQIDDDLLDIFGDAKKMQKNTFQDIESSQATLLTAFALDNKKFKGKITPYLGKKLDDKDKKNIKRIFEDSNALDNTNSEKLSYLKVAEKNLLGQNQFQNIWKELLVKISNRTK